MKGEGEKQKKKQTNRQNENKEEKSSLRNEIEEDEHAITDRNTGGVT